MTQKERVLKYMQDFGVITPYAAFRDLGITKLSTRIGELRRDGEYLKMMLMLRTGKLKSVTENRTL